ncbi:MAG: hypothetical protein Q9190_007769, partial [Brigantiaea leucoxantha]
RSRTSENHRMAAKTQNRERVQGFGETEPPAGRRVAAIVQVAERAESVGGVVEFEAGGAVCATGGWLCGGGERQDVLREE